jgi:hypothetical protein
MGSWTFLGMGNAHTYEYVLALQVDIRPECVIATRVCGMHLEKPFLHPRANILADSYTGLNPQPSASALPEPFRG